MKHILRSTIVAFTFILGINHETIAQPANEDCAFAVTLNCASQLSSFTHLSSVDAAPMCSGVPDGTSGGNWYIFYGNGGLQTVALCGTTGALDSRLRVYTGTCGAFTCVAGGDDDCGTSGLLSIVSFFSTNLTPYYALVHGAGASVGVYTIKLTCQPPPPPNTFCYSDQPIPYNPDPLSGTPIFLTDDLHSASIPMGFGFCYNGVTYTDAIISSNNYITFDPFLANTYSPWNTVAVPSLTPGQVANSIMLPWQDINPATGGNIFYTTLGTAPFRRFVVTYLNVPMFSCTSQLYTSQMILYESSNCIGTMIDQKPICLSWNNGEAVHGLQNLDATQAITVTGRNNTAWAANSSGHLFTPTCAPCSTEFSTDCFGVILPLELLYFRGHSNSDENSLEWATASELNTHHFEVERSTDGVEFARISTIDAAGSSQQTIEYGMNDIPPVIGLNYYRLKSVDLDGSFTTSEIVALETKLGGQPVIYPNPATNEFYVRLPSNIVLPTSVIIRDISGRQVRSLSIDALETPISMDNLASGSYFVEIPALGSGSTTRLIVE